jgi:hypothetical protein
MAEPESTSPPTPIPTSLNVTALAKRLGLDRRTVQRRLAKGWVPPADAASKRKTAQARAASTPQVSLNSLAQQTANNANARTRFGALQSRCRSICGRHPQTEENCRGLQ